MSAASPMGWPLRRALLAAAVLLVVLQAVARLVPPLQSPDELSHMVRIASITEGELMPRTERGLNTGGSFDISLAVLSRAYVPIIKERDPAVEEAHRVSARTQGWIRQTTYGEAPGSAVYLPAVYLPAAAGLALGRAMEWTVWESYQLARLTSQVFCVALIALAAWIWRPPLLAWAVLLLPMSLFQMAAPVVDGPAHAMAVLSLSLFMRLRQKPSVALAVATCASLVLLVTTRMHLLPLLLLPLWWSWQGTAAAASSARPAVRAALLGGVTVLLACGLWVLWVMLSVVDTRVERPLGTGAVARHYLMHPEQTWEVFSRTFADPQRREFLADSFIGNLGWLDTRLPEEAYALLWTGLLVIALLALPWREPLSGTRRDRMALLGGAAAAVLIAFVLMLLTWSPFPTAMIEGVQGRYFIAPALVVAYAAGAWVPSGALRPTGSATRLWPWVRWGALSLFASVSLWALITTLLARYPAWARGGLMG